MDRQYTYPTQLNQAMPIPLVDLLLIIFPDADEARAAITAGGKSSYHLPHDDFLRAVAEVEASSKAELGAVSLPLLTDAEKMVQLEHPDIGDDERKVAATLKVALEKKVK